MDLYRMSRAARAADEAAKAAAVRLGHGAVASVHVLLGLLGAQSVAAAALRRAGVDEKGLEAQASALYEGPPLGRARDLQLGEEWREVMDGAREEAETAGAAEIEPAHVLLAATSDDTMSAVHALGGLRVDVEALRRDVAKASDAADRAE
jgi:ATP-dependent Clp protease ATP-binding subunit ClpA